MEFTGGGGEGGGGGDILGRFHDINIKTRLVSVYKVHAELARDYFKVDNFQGYLLYTRLVAGGWVICNPGSTPELRSSRGKAVFSRLSRRSFFLCLPYISSK